MEKIGSTSWRKIQTNTGKQYYYNVETKETTWSMPIELFAMDFEDPEQNEGGDAPEGNGDDTSESSSVGEKRKSEQSDEPEGKSAKTDDVDESDGPTEQERIEIFKQMLREKNVARFGNWEKELPKFAFDPRFKILPKYADRITVFEDYVRNVVVEQKQERKDKIQSAKDAASNNESLMSQLTPDMTFDQFKELIRGEEAFKILVTKDKEKVFQELVEPLKKKESEEKENNRLNAMDDFEDLLAETKGITALTPWIKARKLLEKDERFHSEFLDAKSKEDLFQKYIGLLKEESQKKKDREEAAKKEREQQVSKTRQVETREREKVAGRSRDQENTILFQVMLREEIRDPRASWSRSRKILEADSRWESSHIPTEMKEKLFRDHLKNIQAERAAEFRSLLADKADIDFDSRFDDIRHRIIDDPRYDSVDSEERREIFEKFRRDFKKKCYDDFDDMLTESHRIGHVTSKSVTHGKPFENLVNLISTDKRWQKMKDFESDRESMLIEFIEKLKKKGDQ
eukprot:TRINITY_DN1378_c0_g1_i13.p1 TRINITY_DN1378_c0_g1~~TRINITY_DN1378_c0_g1_i13.p1  ORF type:complete len:515 (+),score=220.97 TRINITY_DN1378_c0_g1_i13:401-1945(+)